MKQDLWVMRPVGTMKDRWVRVFHGYPDDVGRMETKILESGVECRMRTMPELVLPEGASTLGLYPVHLDVWKREAAAFAYHQRVVIAVDRAFCEWKHAPAGAHLARKMVRAEAAQIRQLRENNALYPMKALVWTATLEIEGSILGQAARKLVNDALIVPNRTRIDCISGSDARMSRIRTLKGV